MKKTLLAALAVCTVLGSCNTRKTTGSDITIDLSGKWTIVKAGDIATDKAEQTPFINFTDSGTVTGYASVNNFFGSYTAKGDSLSFDNMGMTMMAGPDMDIEMAIVQALNDSKTIAVQGDTILVKDAEGKTVMTLLRD